MFARLPLIALALFLSLALLACGSAPQNLVEPPRKAGERLYYEGVEYLHGGAYLEAQNAFRDCLKLPAYLQVTSLALLRLGDTYYYQHKYPHAIEEYRSFAQRHDGSPNVPYARFMIAASYFGQIPTGFWLLPPVYEMDLSAADQARYHLEHFMRRYPLSVYATEAAKLREKTIDLQLAHHEYVIRFYGQRHKWLGVVFRLHLVMRKFPRRGHRLRHYVLLARAYRRLGWRRRALELQRAIAHRWPTSPEAAVARAAVADLRAEITRLKASGDPAAEMPLDLPPTAKYRPEVAVLQSPG